MNISDSINQETAAISSDEDNQLKQQGKIKEGIATSDHATELSSDSALAYYNLGETLARQWRWEEAKAAYSKAIELNPNYFEAHQKLGEALHAAEKLEEAIASYLQAIAISSNIGVSSDDLHLLYFNLGEALQRQGKFEEAIACYHKSLELNSASARVYHHLGVALSALQRWDEVVVANAIKMKPHIFQALHKLESALAQYQLEIESASYLRRIELNLEFRCYQLLSESLQKQNYLYLIGLIINAENLYDRQKQYQESQKTRIIKPGSGRPPKLTIADQILLTHRIPASPTHLSNSWSPIWNWRINR